MAEFIDPSRRKLLEQLESSQHNVSHKAFVSATRAIPEKGNWGGGEGCFSYPPPFVGGGAGNENNNTNIINNNNNNTSNNNSSNHGGGGATALQQYTLMQPPTIRIGKSKKGGCGVPNVCIGPDPEHMKDVDYRSKEKFNQMYKLGMHDAYRAGAGHPPRAFLSTSGGGLFNPGVFSSSEGTMQRQEQQQQEQKERPQWRSKAAELARRADHTGAWNPGAKATIRPNECFSQYRYMSDPYIDNRAKYLKKVMQAKTLPAITNKPFLPNSTAKEVLPTSTVMFHNKQH